MYRYTGWYSAAFNSPAPANPCVGHFSVPPHPERSFPGEGACLSIEPLIHAGAQSQPGNANLLSILCQSKIGSVGALLQYCCVVLDVGHLKYIFCEWYFWSPDFFVMDILFKCEFYF